MNNKKKYIITGSVAAAALLVGGTAAFFTSSDFIVNPFATGAGVTNSDKDAGIKIIEDFNGPLVGTDTSIEQFDDGLYDDKYGDYDSTKEETLHPTAVVPGVVYNKEVRVASEVNYDQYVKAWVEVKWSNLPTSIPDSEAWRYLTIEYNTTPESTTEGAWIGNVPAASTILFKGNGKSSNLFFYSHALGGIDTPASKVTTADLIKSVKLVDNAPNTLKSTSFEVIVHAESIQATEDAWSTFAVAVTDGGNPESVLAELPTNVPTDAPQGIDTKHE